MSEKEYNRQIRQEIVGNSGWAFFNMILIVIILILVIVYCIRAPSDCVIVRTQNAALCDDCNPCSDDFVTSDGQSCQFSEKINGVPCNSDDLCFNHSLCTPTCSNGQCVGEVGCCRGFCNVTDDCPNITSITGSISKICDTQFSSCLYQVTDTNTNDCFALIQPVNLHFCLNARVTQDFFGNLGCDYWFSCAPRLNGESEPAFVMSFNLSIYTDAHIQDIQHQGITKETYFSKMKNKYKSKNNNKNIIPNPPVYYSYKNSKFKT